MPGGRGLGVADGSACPIFLVALIAGMVAAPPIRTRIAAFAS